MVEASLGPWTGCQGAQRLLALVDQSGLGQLSARGHATVGGVDEEGAPTRQRLDGRAR